MAEEKKTTTAKKSTAQKAPAKKQAPKKEVETEVVIQEEQVEEKREIDKDTEVVVYNNTNSEVYYEARKGTGFLELANFMDSDVMTVEELQQMRNGARKVLEDGWIFVDDEEVLEHLRLNKLKNAVKSPQFLEDLVESGDPAKIAEVVEKLTSNSKATLYGIVSKKYKDGELSNIHIIKTVEEALGIDPKTDSLLLD